SPDRLQLPSPPGNFSPASSSNTPHRILLTGQSGLAAHGLGVFSQLAGQEGMSPFQMHQPSSPASIACQQPICATWQGPLTLPPSWPAQPHSQTSPTGTQVLLDLPHSFPYPLSLHPSHSFHSHPHTHCHAHPHRPRAQSSSHVPTPAAPSALHSVANAWRASLLGQLHGSSSIDRARTVGKTIGSLKQAGNEDVELCLVPVHSQRKSQAAPGAGVNTQGDGGFSAAGEADQAWPIPGTGSPEQGLAAQPPTGLQHPSQVHGPAHHPLQPGQNIRQEPGQVPPPHRCPHPSTAQHRLAPGPDGCSTAALAYQGSSPFLLRYLPASLLVAVGATCCLLTAAVTATSDARARAAAAKRVAAVGYGCKESGIGRRCNDRGSDKGAGRRRGRGQ
ncbi:hypothetical protein V8C86DRAFT_2773200, partial [Haematococcus lacustris]